MVAASTNAVSYVKSFKFRVNKRGDIISPTDKHEMKGKVTVILRDRDGKIVRTEKVKNLIVSSGKMFIANLFRGQESQAVSHMAVGTGRSKPGSGDVALEEEISPRSAFDKNFLSPEKSAFLPLRDAAKKDVLKLISRICGERGNFISVEVKKSSSDNFSLYVYGETDEEFVEEEFKDLSMNPKDKRNAEKVINIESQLLGAKSIVNSTPVNMIRSSLEQGQDAIVTLGATFGYEECNGPISEAGIFNSSREGTMYNRVVFPEINKTDKLTLSLIWKISF